MSKPDPSARVSRSDLDRGDESIRVCMISLGCPKNLVDSETILGNIGQEGLAITSSPEAADVILVNTCGFIRTAKEESIQTILEMCEIKRASASPKRVVVTGCLGQRYGEELRKEVPEVDAIIGLGEYTDIGETIISLVTADRPEKLLQVSDPTKACNADVGRFRLTPSHYAYVRISEGCDNPCTFCAIPAIRGRFRSKPVQAIVEEVHELVASGAKEIILISQDTTSYGVDLSGKFELPSLLETLNSVKGVEWIRLLYAYPAFLDDAMIDAVASLEKVLKYVDLPLQHISDTMLRRMGRRLNESKTRALLQRLRTRIPGLCLRTTFIVGFPGESEEDFATLLDFVREFRFERLGVFPYSEEEGTPAADFASPIPQRVRARRAREIMLAQQEIAFRHNKERESETVRVIVDGEARGRRGGPRLLRARSHGEAPEIDPCILLRLAGTSRSALHGDKGARVGSGALPSQASTSAMPQPGDFVLATITGTKGYDLLAVPARPACPAATP